MELDPWQDLDIDDSDLSSLLRPCKRRRSPPPATSPIPPEKVHRQPLSPHSVSKTISCSRTIPGPAGAVHAAMLRKTLDRSLVSTEDSVDCNDNDAIIPTQEYIRRAVEDTAEFDDDFTRPPWLSALRFLGSEDGEIPSTPISSIKKHLDMGKVNQVVAVIKSRSPSGLGGLKLILKDPTGSVGATVHPKVLCESEFGKNLGVGAVLILQKVAIFSPSSTALYLNITLQNVVKVFCHVDCHPILDGSAHSVQYDDAAIDYGKHAKTWEKTWEKMSVMQKKVTIEDTAKEMTQDAGSSQTLHTHSIIQNRNLFANNFQPEHRDLFHVSVAMTNGCQHASREKPEDVFRTKPIFDQQDQASGGDNCAKGGNSDHSLPSSVTKNREEVQETNEVQMRRQPLIAKSFVPQWTDEQLDELFNDDDYNRF